MKKTLMALALSMAVSASCFAAGASGRFAAEEKTADALIAALIGNGTYEQVSKSFSQPLKANVTAEKFAALKKDIKTKVGTIKNPSFVQLMKPYTFQKGYNGIDALIYLGAVDAEKGARILIEFIEENNAPKVADINVSLMPLQQAKPAQEEAPKK